MPRAANPPVGPRVESLLVAGEEVPRAESLRLVTTVLVGEVMPRAASLLAAVGAEDPRVPRVKAVGAEDPRAEVPKPAVEAVGAEDLNPAAEAVGAEGPKQAAVEAGEAEARVARVDKVGHGEHITVRGTFTEYSVLKFTHPVR
jgi:hypothetical protein